MKLFLHCEVAYHLHKSLKIFPVSPTTPTYTSALKEYKISAPLSTMQLHDYFKSIKAARDAITRFVLDEGESFYVEKSVKKQLTIICKERFGFWFLVSSV